VELAVTSSGRVGAGSLSMQVYKVSRVTTIHRVAKRLGESVDVLFEIANEMDVEDGVIWVYDAGDHEIIAFTDRGVENFVELIKIY
jgi:hypothetical protein